MTGECFTITVPGKPQGKGRARFNRHSGVAYTPAKTASYENLIKVLALDAMKGRAPVECACKLVVIAACEIPKSWSGKKRRDAEFGWIKPTGRPDLDNVTKACLDGLNGVAFRDDSLVTDIDARKYYGTTPCLTITVQPLEER